MDALQIVRYVLYGAEWIFSTVVWGGTADKLRGDRNCFAFGEKIANCNTAIAFGVIAWLVLTVLIIARLLSVFLSKFGLSEQYEFYAFVGLTVWWIIPAIVLSAGRQGGTGSLSSAVVAFSWINLILSAVLAGIAFQMSRRGDDDQSAPAPVMHDV